MNQQSFWRQSSSERRAGVLGALLVLAACASQTAPDSQARASGGAGGTEARGGSTGATTGGTQAGAPDGSGAAAGEASGPAPHVFSIEFDYRFDKAGFFDDQVRRDALELAARHWSRVLANDFPAIPAGTRLRVTDPENRDQELWVDGIEHDIDDVLVFVGTSDDIPGYGRGGPSSVAESDDSTLNEAFQNRQASKRFQPWAGSITFKRSANYFFPAAESDDVPSDEYDFVSLATHEIGHVLGFSTAPAFSALEKGTTFVGKTAVASYGGPVPLTDDLKHLADGTQSDGVEALMTPNLPLGTRQHPTALDLATLFDLGYTAKP
jgi:hypothetical protein